MLVVFFISAGSSDKEQLSYTTTRIDDIEILSNAKFRGNVKPVLRVFVGDNPARQFESGQQRGGKFSCVCGVPSSEHSNLICCFQTESHTLEDRRKLVTAGLVWTKLQAGITNPFQNLKKNEIIEELESRNIWPEDEKKTSYYKNNSKL